MRVLKKSLAAFLSFFIVISIFSGNQKVFASDIATVAQWNITASPTATDVPATGGSNAQGAVLNTSGLSATPFWTSSKGYGISGWDNGSGTKAWVIQLSTRNYENLTLAMQARSSGTGPRDFAVQYSIGGGSWTAIQNSAYSLKNANLADCYPAPLALPGTLSNSDSVRLRLIMSDNTNFNGTGDVGSTGTSNINNVVITGTKIADPTAVADVVASPGSTAVALGSKVQLSTPTDGATIYYAVGEGSFSAYNPQTGLTVDTLPETIRAYAAKAGMSNSETVSWSYTQLQADSVNASPGGGSANIGDTVTLSCPTDAAQILYSTNGGSSWTTYAAPFKITALPETVTAYAKKDGWLDGTKATYTFSADNGGDYKTYFGQLHSHTNFSDGVGSVDDAFQYAKNTAKVDFQAVTDHSNYFDNELAASMNDGSMSTKWVKGHQLADQYTDSNFVGIYAYEMTWSNGLGHINTFNTPGFETRDASKFEQSDALQQYYATLKQHPDSISQFNHPGTTFGDFNDFANYDPDIDKLITMVEVGNGEGQVRGSGYFPSYDYYQRALDKGWHLGPTNNQDNHKGNWGNSNTARTVVLAKSLTRDNIYDAMRNRRMYATEDNNLQIKYTLNGSVMGTILSQRPDNADIKVSLNDPDGESLGKVSVITSGGKVVASKALTTSSANVEFNLPDSYAYYYIRVDEADKDIAVTAPVWTGTVDKAGVAKTAASTTLPIKGKSVNITSSLYNNESSGMDVENIQYSVNGAVINSSNNVGTVASLGTKDYSFAYTPASSGKQEVDVKVTANINNVPKIFTDVLQLTVTDPAVVTNIAVDSSHQNDYVSGYYSGNMKNFTTLANGKGMAVNMITGGITSQSLADTQLLVVTPPAKKTGTTKTGVNYQPQSFSDDEIAAIKSYANSGGSIILCGTSDYGDGTGVYQTTTQMNKLLSAIGATTRLNNDEVMDDSLNGGQNYRLDFKNYNTGMTALTGVAPTQPYSFYSGCSVNLDSSALSSGKARWLVKGYNSTYSKDSNANVTGVSLPKGSVYALAQEQLPGGGQMYIGGTIFMSDFELEATLDNYSQSQNSNYSIVSDILNTIKKEQAATPIKTVRAGQMGQPYTVEGTVTAGTQQGNAFTDTIYVQDSTGGIDIYPISGQDIKVGQKVRVTGSLDQYQGDTELKVIDSSVTNPSVNPVAPKLITTDDVSAGTNLGALSRVYGTVDWVDSVGGVINDIHLKDTSGTDARLLINGYIGYSDPNSPLLESFVKPGTVLSAVGVAYTDPQGSCLRVRDKSEITAMPQNFLADVTDLISRINALPENPDQQQVEALSAKYNALSADQKALVTNYSKLAAAEARAPGGAQTPVQPDPASTPPKPSATVSTGTQAVGNSVANPDTNDAGIPPLGALLVASLGFMIYSTRRKRNGRGR